MTEIFIELQDPIIELKVQATDGAKKTSTITVGFKRPATFEEGDELLKVFDEVGRKNDTEEVNQFIENLVEYIKDVKLRTRLPNGELKLVRTVTDSRKEKDNEELWGAAADCTSYLLRKHLSVAPWRLAFVNAVYTALSNRDLFSEASLKNL